MASQNPYPHDHTIRLRGVPAPARTKVIADVLAQAEARLGPRGGSWIAEMSTKELVLRFKCLEDMKRLDRAFLAQGVTQGGVDAYHIFEQYEHHYELDLTRHHAVHALEVRLRLVSITRGLLGPTGARWDFVASNDAVVIGIADESDYQVVGEALRNYLREVNAGLGNR